MIALSKLTYNDLERVSAWRVIEETIDDEDILLEPAWINKMGQVEKDNSEVWCLCKAVFTNGDEYKASAMCRGDTSDEPFLMTVFDGVEDIRIIIPPAPDFVLNAEGPDAFSKKV